MEHVPYVTANKQVAYGTLVSDLTLAGNITTRPQDHQAHFMGEPPCHKNGQQIAQIINQVATRELAEGIRINVSFSSKPKAGYADYHEKMTTYANILASPARSLDPTVTARTGRAVPSEGDEETVFHYLDTATTRAGIGVLSNRLSGLRLGIVGLGGTGAYVLDLVAKTPVDEIHLFDGDVFRQHNAFRSPGAPSIEELAALPQKVDFLAARYSPMRTGIIPHAVYLDESNVSSLGGLDFAFICMDSGSAKKCIVGFLEEQGTAFIDVGMGVELTDGDSLGGIVRVTLSTADKRDHLPRRVGFGAHFAENDYERNIQIADLNCLNAALAVVKWKKHCGFYRDLEREHSSTYTTDSNMLLSEDAP